MCGITAIINHKHILSANHLIQANSLVSHRGPDDEGYLLWNTAESFQFFSGKDTASASKSHHQLDEILSAESKWLIGLGHRRLSILDLSPSGHQPMPDGEDLVLTYNGEIFNYIEVREELKALGYVFHSATDTEVILKAWKHWGPQSLHKFNGMFAFVIVDAQSQKLYAVRDRFGVKPLYYTTTESYTAFASEAKQLRSLPDYNFVLNERVAYNYLRFSNLDYNEETFEENILQVSPGHYIEINLLTGKKDIYKWYSLEPKQWEGTDQEAISQFYFLLEDSVKIRLRSDVPLGAALSGGLDSSSLVCLMNDLLNETKKSEHAIQTISSCSEDKRYDEWDYAELVVKQVGASSSKVFPSFGKLLKDIDRLIWHMDYPFGSTSQFSQWCVFEEAQRNKLVVMINGQGADEQLAGYGGNDMSLYIGLLHKKKFAELLSEVRAYKKYNGQWPFAFLVGAIQHKLPKRWMKKVPDRYKVVKQLAPPWLKPSIPEQEVSWPDGLNESLVRQITQNPLPSLLRYEDRNSMAFSVESRVPFMDHRLIEFTLGLPENLVYRKGERKYILRKAFQGKVPEKIIQRRDKMGFVSAEERWMKEEGKAWFERMIAKSEVKAGFINKDVALDYLHQMQKGIQAFNFDPWRIICFSAWVAQVSGNKVGVDTKRSAI